MYGYPRKVKIDVSIMLDVVLAPPIAYFNGMEKHFSSQLPRNNHKNDYDHMLLG